MAPVAAMLRLRHPDNPAHRTLFGMSKSAWEVRLQHLERDAAAIAPGLLQAQQELLSPFTDRRRCKNCGEVFLVTKGEETCPACHSTRLQWLPRIVRDYPWEGRRWRQSDAMR